MRQTLTCLLWGVAACGVASPPPVAPSPREATCVAWTVVDVSLVVPATSPDDASGGPRDVCLRPVRRAFVDEATSTCEPNEWGWVLVEPNGAAFVSIGGVWWPVVAYGPPSELAACEQRADMSVRSQGPDDEVDARCPLRWVPRGVALPPRFEEVWTRWRKEHLEFEKERLRLPLEAALTAYAEGHDAWALHLLDQVARAQEELEWVFVSQPHEGDGWLDEADRLRGALRSPREPAADGSTIASLLAMRGFPGDGGPPVQERPAFRSVERLGVDALLDLEACSRREWPSRYVVAEGSAWHVLSEGELCNLVEQAILGGEPSP
ncbi:MAG: hypothetical protein H6722_19015 [Sandaracinus sp.]|nr:hypothetical protein [Sandaracinus sp.]MCB9622941.1 hypothetical protein [Sandaracinus sp.]